MDKLIVDASNIVMLNNTRIGRIVTKTGMPAIFETEHPSFSQDFAKYNGLPIATITTDGRRAYAPRIAELLGLIDNFGPENNNILFSKL